MRAVLALRSWSAMAGLFVVALWLVLAIFAPWLAPYDPLISYVPLLPPIERGPAGQMFWLGTDMLGRDILSRLIHGARSVVIWSTLATGAAYAVGILTGLLANLAKLALPRLRPRGLPGLFSQLSEPPTGWDTFLFHCPAPSIAKLGDGSSSIWQSFPSALF